MTSEESPRNSEPAVTLPFNVRNLLGGLAQGKGLAKASPSELILEFVVADSVLGLLKSRVKDLHIPQSEIDAIRLTRGWFGAKVMIRVKSLKWLADLPGCDKGEVTLHIARRDRDQAADFVRVLGSR